MVIAPAFRRLAAPRDVEARPRADARRDGVREGVHARPRRRVDRRTHVRARDRVGSRSDDPPSLECADVGAVERGKPLLGEGRRRADLARAEGRPRPAEGRQVGLNGAKTVVERHGTQETRALDLEPRFGRDACGILKYPRQIPVADGGKRDDLGHGWTPFGRYGNPVEDAAVAPRLSRGNRGQAVAGGGRPFRPGPGRCIRGRAVIGLSRGPRLRAAPRIERRQRVRSTLITRSPEEQKAWRIFRQWSKRSFRT